MHPLAVSAGLNDSGMAEIRQMPRYLRLALFEDFNKVADAQFLVPHQVEQAEPRLVSQSLEEALHIQGR